MVIPLHGWADDGNTGPGIFRPNIFSLQIKLPIPVGSTVCQFYRKGTGLKYLSLALPANQKFPVKQWPMGKLRAGKLFFYGESAISCQSNSPIIIEPRAGRTFISLFVSKNQRVEPPVVDDQPFSPCYEPRLAASSPLWFYLKKAREWKKKKREMSTWLLLVESLWTLG